MNHATNCSGCPTCSYALGDQLREALSITNGVLLAEIDAAKLRINQEKNMKPINPYEPGLKALRVAAATASAAATPESRFAEQYKEDRLAALEREHAAIDAHIAAAPRLRLTTAEELTSAAPPDPYAEPLRRLKEERTRG